MLYPEVFNKAIESGELTYAFSYRWLLSYGMSAESAAKGLRDARMKSLAKVENKQNLFPYGSSDD